MTLDFLALINQEVCLETGKPDIRREQMNQFKVVRDEDYKLIDEIVTEFAFGKKIFPAKKTTIAQSTARILEILPAIKVEPIVGLAKPQYARVILPRKFNHLVALFNQKHEEAPRDLINRDPADVLSWLVLFGIYPEFEPYYQQYLLNPDSNVTEATQDDELMVQSDPIAKLTPDKENFTRTDLVVSVHLILLCMHKNLDIDTQLNEFVGRRTKAIQSNISIDKSDLLYHVEFLKKVHVIFGLMPKLKTQLFLFIYYNRNIYTEFEATVTLLNYSSMTTIKEIYKFTTSTLKTPAHRHPTILMEMARFHEVMDEKENTHRALWPYYRFVNPTDGTINLSNYPNLAAAAIYFAKAHGGQTYENYKVSTHNVTIANLSEMVKIRDDPKYWKSETALDKNHKDIMASAARQGLKLDMVSGNVQGEMGADAGLMPTYSVTAADIQNLLGRRLGSG